MAVAVIVAIARPAATGAAARLLDVPFLAQTDRLCGGAALAMVMRFWGARDVYPQDFESLVDASRGGIPGSALVSAAERGGWRATTDEAAAGSTDALAAALDQGRPPIALLDTGDPVAHYVVVTGMTPAVVVVHDPAQGPFRVLTRDAFDRAWTVAGAWMLVVVPGPALVPGGSGLPPRGAPPVAAVPRATETACDPLVSQAIAEARDGREVDAERLLRAATALCPSGAAAWAELAGLRLVQRQFRPAASLAAKAARLDPADQHTWQVLAASRFAAGDYARALDAWNHVGEPTMGTLTASGLRRLPSQLVAEMAALRPRAVLDADAFRRAMHRLDELPTTARTHLTFDAPGQGPSDVRAGILERKLLPAGIIGISGVALRAAVVHELRVDIAGAARRGEVLSPSYRWSARRPRVGLAFSAPLTGPVPGIATVGASWERQTYGEPATPGLTREETRRRAEGGFSAWSAGWFRWEAGAALDRIATRSYGALRAGATTRWFADRVSATLAAERWLAAAPSPGFATIDATGSWRSTTHADVAAWTAVAGLSVASAGAPLAVWPGASSALGRGVLLRAHPLLDHDVVTGAVFGRRLAHASAEFTHPLRSTPLGQVSVAGFADAARAWRGMPGARTSPTELDLGVGLRLHATAGEQLRIDLAVGARDGRVALSAGYVTPWGRRGD